MKFKFIIIILVIFSTNIFSQEFITEEEVTEKSDAPTFWERTYWGGDFGLMFGSATSIILSPEMGYMITKDFSIGGGVIFQYYKSNYNNYESTIYGGKIFTRYFIWQNLYAIGILEIVNLERYSPYYTSAERYWFASPLIGGGYMQRFSNKGGIGISFLFNLNNDIYSPYYGQAMPIIRIGFSI